MSNVFFHPYIGSFYNHSFQRTMVLDDSPYCERGCADCGVAQAHHECQALTQNLMNCYLDENRIRQRWMSGYPDIERSLWGDIPKYPRQWSWRKILYYNYSQVAGNGNRKAGDRKQYADSAEAFFEVIDTYKPRYIIVWGERLWEHLPKGDRWAWNPDILLGSRKNKCGNYLFQDGTVAKTLLVRHPLTDDDWKYSYKVIQKLLKDDELYSFF